MSRLAIGAGLATDPDPQRAVEAACAEADRRPRRRVPATSRSSSSRRITSRASPMRSPPRTRLSGRGRFSDATACGSSEAPERSRTRRPSRCGRRISPKRRSSRSRSSTPRRPTERRSWAGPTRSPKARPRSRSPIRSRSPPTTGSRGSPTRIPGSELIGGLASGGRAPGQHRLIMDTEVRNGGCVGALIAGRVKVRSLVSQGCKPVGQPYAVTGAERNVLLSLGGQTPLDRIRETFAAADASDREAMQLGLHVGRVVDEYKTEFRRGDFLVRNVLGADEQSGAVAVGDVVSIGETVQFHVRDAASADEDLRTMVGARRSSGGCAAVHLQRARHAAVRRSRPRRRHRHRRVRVAAGRVLLQRGARPGRWAQLPPRLHREPGALLRLLTGYAFSRCSSS